MSLVVVPASRADVSAFVSRMHRNHKPAVGDVFRLACVDDTGVVRGVASVGRPIARMLDDGWTLEVSRVATDGVKNGCSLLYGAARRVAWTMGYRRIVTYTLPEEGGASLRAAGWTEGGLTDGGDNWLSHPRGRVVERADKKTRWMCVNCAASTVEPVWPDPAEVVQVPLFGGAS